MAAAAANVIRKISFEKNDTGVVSRRWEARCIAAEAKCKQWSLAYKESEAKNVQLREKFKALEARCGS